MSARKENSEEEELDDLLEKQWEMQDQINPQCKMRDKKRKIDWDQ